MLTVKPIDAAKPKDKSYRLLDGNGLYLYIRLQVRKYGNYTSTWTVKKKF